MGFRRVLDVGYRMFIFFKFDEAMSEPGVPEKKRWRKTRKGTHKKIPCFMGEQTAH